MPDWSQLTVGVAAIAGLVLVVRSLRGAQKELLDFLYNHLSENTKAQIATTRALQKLADTVENLAEESRTHHTGEQR